MPILTKRLALALALALLLTPTPSALTRAQEQQTAPALATTPAQAPENGEETGKLPGPEPDVPPQLVPTLPTIPWRQDRLAFGFTSVATTPLPKDKEGIWVLDFAYRPLRIQTIEVPGKGRRAVYYLYYKVVNRTGEPRTFVPQFVMVNEDGRRYEDAVIPQAVPVIKSREDPTVPLRGAVDIMGVIPPSEKQGVDDAVFGVAVWDEWDNASDRFSIYVRGLSDGYKEVSNPDGGEPVVRYKTLRIDFIRRGDEFNISEKAIEPGDPPYDWVYW